MTSRDDMLAQIRREDEAVAAQLSAAQLRSDQVKPVAEKSTGPATTEGDVRGQIEHLRTRHNALQERIRHVNTHTSDAWDDVKHEAEKIWIDLREIAEVVTQVFH